MRHRLAALFLLLALLPPALAAQTPAASPAPPGKAPRRPPAQAPQRPAALPAPVPQLPAAVPAQGPALPPIEVRVLVLNIDPILPEKESKPISTAMGWKDARALAAQYVAEVEKVSHGRVHYRIVEWQWLNEFPVKVDGYRYTTASWLQCWQQRDTCHQPDGTDYPRLISKYGVVPRIDRGEIDELWIFGAPFLGFWESAMAGPGAWEINGGVYDSVPSAKRFAIMGFSYERGVAEMLHDLCHRTEATMTHLHGGWRADSLTNSWAKFAANAFQSNGVSAVGSCHYPPNGVKDYDYANERTVQSMADDYLDYPALDGRTKPVNRDTWGGPDYQLNYLRWWFTRLPHVPGTAPDGTLNDWWGYVFGLNR